MAEGSKRAAKVRLSADYEAYRYFIKKGEKYVLTLSNLSRLAGIRAVRAERIGCELYYCGDIDPEGIEIADRVLARGPEQIFLWRMTVEDYYRTISDEKLTETRLKKLDKVANASLRELAGVVRKEKRAGYQERLIDLMVRDILTCSSKRK